MNGIQLQFAGSEQQKKKKNRIKTNNFIQLFVAATRFVCSFLFIFCCLFVNEEKTAMVQNTQFLSKAIVCVNNSHFL